MAIMITITDSNEYNCIGHLNANDEDNINEK